MENPEPLNEHLKQYGYALNGLPQFRIVFSDDRKEANGEPYYSYISERWVLEKFFPEAQDYIAIWTFSIDGQYIFPQREWLDQLCYIALASPADKKRDLKQMEEDDLQDFIKRGEALLNVDSGGGVHEFKNQSVNFIRPVFMNLDFEIKGKGKK